MLGSSVLNPYSSNYTFTGATGPTGATGSTGPDGYGITGPTGAYVTGITISNNILINLFSNGSTVAASGTVLGPTGPVVVSVAVDTTITGITVSELTGTNNIKIRGLKIKNNTANSQISINQNTNSGILTVKNVPNPGITTDNSYLGQSDLVKIGDDGKYQRSYKVFYDTTNKAINVIGTNFFEKAVNIGANITGPYSYCLSNPGGTTMDCFINPFVGNNDNASHGIPPSVFIIDGNGKQVTVTVPSISSTLNNYVPSFSLYIRNSLNPTFLGDRFKGPIKWPANAVPCHRVKASTTVTESCTSLINFYGIQGVWYASLVDVTSSTSACKTNGLVYKANCDATVADPSFAPTVYIPSGYRTIRDIEITDPEEIDYAAIENNTAQKQLYVSGTTGACCLLDGSCSITNIENCSGYFHGIGTTCGSNDIICNLPGSCCIQYKTYNKFLYSCVDSLTCIECLGYTGMNSVEVKYNGNYSSCDSTNCSDSFEELGACCDGIGGCEYTDYVNCVNSGRFFQGIGITCGYGICNGGTGSCCLQNNSCAEGIGYSECLGLGGIFAGDGTICSDYSCPQKDTCLGYIDGVRIYPGDEYGGGIVVGRFTPGKSQILGIKEYFSPVIDVINSGNTYDLQTFTSFRDHTAYYSDNTRECNSDDSYIIISYPYDVSVVNKQLINPIQTQVAYTDTFVWSHGTTYSSWGPLVDASGTYNDLVLYNDEYEYNKTHLKYSEGYFNGLSGATYSTGITLSESLYSKTFPTCNICCRFGTDTVSRVFGKSVYNLNGTWHNSWGIHNTIRIIGAENCRYFEIDDPSNMFSYTDFITDTTLTAARAASIVPDSITSSVQGITANNNALSDWYLPSHDELGFVALHCVDNSPYIINFNHTLLTKGYQPISGQYWTSNGAFDFKNNEGILGVTVEPGSMAWVMNIDVNGNSDNFIGYKYKRTDTAKVRPIRMLRCDRYYPETLDTDYKLWNVPISGLD